MCDGCGESDVYGYDSCQSTSFLATEGAAKSDAPTDGGAAMDNINYDEEMRLTDGGGKG